ncbi:DUF3238 domain-containing protein [Paenibacillus sp. TY11]|uniref:DUF3238 domain-containing protein n=1 Tax=Paenibacillus sp. TY11 TaxID=3448633 RepID=UPI0040396C39
MAINFNIRLVTFIPHDKVPSPVQYAAPTYFVSFKGDNRGFDKNTANTENFRTAQQINVEFTNTGGSWGSYRNVGTTTAYYLNNTTAKTETSTAKASDSGLTITRTAASLTGSSSDYMKFLCKCSVGNPFIPSPDIFNGNIDYEFTLFVYKNGTISIQGSHDGFPAYEVYAQANSGGYQNIYLFDPRDHGKTSMALLPPMDVTGVSTSRKIL